MDSSTPFTASQWQELHCQAMIFKHLVAGQPVPPELVMPIKRSFEAVASRFCHQTPLAYYPYFGKKLDTEPGRCRRTDGKKWRCSKDAHPDSKYCERHMNRGRSRSRKPVETKTTTQMQTSPSPASSSLTNVTSTESSGSKAIDSFGSSCQTGVLPHFSTNVQLQGSYSGTKVSQLQRDPGSYLARGNNDYSRLEGAKFDMNQHSIPFDAVEGVKGFDIDFSLGPLGNSWNLMAPGVSSLSTPKDRNEPDLPSSYTEFQSSQDQQEQHCFFGNDFGSLEPLKQDTRSLRPFFDEWPKTRNSWFGIDSDQCDKNAFNTTQLSMSTPMSSSDFSTTASRSPVDG